MKKNRGTNERRSKTHWTCVAVLMNHRDIVRVNRVFAFGLFPFSNFDDLLTCAEMLRSRFGSLICPFASIELIWTEMSWNKKKFWRLNWFCVGWIEFRCQINCIYNFLVYVCLTLGDIKLTKLQCRYWGEYNCFQYLENYSYT